MSVGRILTLGLGAFGGVNYLPTLGYVAGEAVAVVEERPAGGFFAVGDKRRSKRDVDEDRRRFGISVPEEVAEVIERAAADQVADSVTDPKKQHRDLQMRLRVAELRFETRYLQALAAERERLIHEELARFAEMTRINNENVTRLMLLALLDS